MIASLGAHLDQAARAPSGEVLGVVELVADRLLGLARRSARRRRARRAGRRASARRRCRGRVGHAERRAARRSGARRRPGRRRAGSLPAITQIVGALREVEELLDEALDLVGGHLGAALVDLGLLAGGRVDDREVGPRLARDPREVVEDRLLGEALEDPRAGRRRRRGRWRSPGRPSSFSARATLTPLPPATVRDSTARWRWPSRKFGTATVRSIAALRVTVRITSAARSRLLELRAPASATDASRARRRRTDDQRPRRRRRRARARPASTPVDERRRPPTAARRPAATSPTARRRA